MSANKLIQLIFSKEFANRVYLGLVIGIASITPGLSGGVIAAAAGIYEPAIHAIVSVRKEFRKSALFLAPLGIGAGIGVLLFSRVMQELMARARFGVLYVFLGLVAGGIPALVGEANRGGFKLKYLLVVLLAFASVIWASQIPAWAPGQSGEDILSSVNVILYGVVLAVGTTVPGISSSFLLIHLGVYEELLYALTRFDIRVLFFLGCGFAGTGLLIVKLVEFLFRRFRGPCYCAVVGFLLGSMVSVFPGFRSGLGLVLDVFLFIGGAAVSYAVTRIESRRA